MADISSSVVRRGDIQGMNVQTQNVMSFEQTENLTDEAMRIISDLNLSRMAFPDNGGLMDFQENLDVSLGSIHVQAADGSMMDNESNGVLRHPHAIDEVRLLMENLDIGRAHNFFQMAMTRLEEEFEYLLVHSGQPLEPDCLSFRSSETDFCIDFSNNSFGEELIQERSQRDGNDGPEEYLVDLISPDVLPDLKCIAKVMFMSNYHMECCQSYIAIRKGTLNECLSLLHNEKFSIEEVLEMNWEALNLKIKRWNRAMKLFIRVYLASEKHLCDLIFGDLSESVSRTCFSEIAAGLILQLLNFAYAVAIGTPAAEKVSRILDMYEVLLDLLPDMESLFSKESNSCVIDECQEILSRLGDYVKGAFKAFKDAIQSKTPSVPHKGGIHPATRYVMNYIQLIADYNETLGHVFRGLDNKNVNTSPESSDMNSGSSTFIALTLQPVISTLESYLERSSLLYQDDSLKHFFLMNNMFYMVKKVRESDHIYLLEDNWLKAHIRTYRHHSMNYERSSWSQLLSFLKDLQDSPSKTTVKERFNNFNLAFEDIYKTQTAWQIPDADLCEDMRISISIKVLQAYRTFLGRYASVLDSVRHKERYIKYSTDDLQNYLLDLFGGSYMSLQSHRKR